MIDLRPEPSSREEPDHAAGGVGHGADGHVPLQLDLEAEAPMPAVAATIATSPDIRAEVNPEAWAPLESV